VLTAVCTVTTACHYQPLLSMYCHISVIFTNTRYGFQTHILDSQGGHIFGQKIFGMSYVVYMGTLHNLNTGVTITDLTVCIREGFEILNADQLNLCMN